MSDTVGLEALLKQAKKYVLQVEKERDTLKRELDELKEQDRANTELIGVFNVRELDLEEQLATEQRKVERLEKETKRLETVAIAAEIYRTHSSVLICKSKLAYKRNEARDTGRILDEALNKLAINNAISNEEYEQWLETQEDR